MVEYPIVPNSYKKVEQQKIFSPLLPQLATAS